MLKPILIAAFLLFSFTAGFSQFVLRPIPKSPPKTIRKSNNNNAKVTGQTSLLLPFWDDFSVSNSKNYPSDSLWQLGHSVTRNFGEGLNAPSLGVVTFDGLDSLGNPYNVTDPFAKGYADTLVSQPIRLDTVPLNLRNTVYLSFFYEPKGNGEVPDPGDNLEVDFKNNLGQWEIDTLIMDDGTLRTDTFNIMMIPIAADRFFNPDFQFRFRNYGRLSGPYDNWNIDYVYLNSGRSPTDVIFPDRAISSPMTSLFNEYWSIPKNHFITDVTANLNTPSVNLYNLSTIDQPLNFSYSAEVITYQGQTGISSGPVQLEDSTSLGAILPLSRKTGTVTSVPPPNMFDPTADSFNIKLKFGLRTKDNVLLPPADNGDYDSAKYKPIDFRVNDTTRAAYNISNYYAYDDGSAEYGIGLNQPGARVAYLFDMKTPNTDGIVAVDIYFPRFGDESPQILELDILKDTSNTASSLLYSANINVIRSEMDTLRRYVVDTTNVQGSFYIGWTQSSAASIPVGWDMNTDSGSKIFYNLNGTWLQNLTQHGSMMIHPVFAKAGVVSGLPENSGPILAFPNPNAGTFMLSGQPDYLELFDLAGQKVQFSQEKPNQQTRIQLSNPNPGLYILKLYTKGKYENLKIIVRP